MAVFDRAGFQAALRLQAQLRDLAAQFARGLLEFSSTLQSEGAGNAGRPMRPIAACADLVVESTRVSQVTPESPGIPRAMVYGLLRALPGDRALLPPSPLRSLLLKSLTPASGCQDHTTSPSALASPVSRAAASIASRPDVRNVRVTPSEWDRMASLYSCFYQTEKRNIFRAGTGHEFC